MKSKQRENTFHKNNNEFSTHEMKLGETRKSKSVRAVSVLYLLCVSVMPSIILTGCLKISSGVA